ncbi:MAG: DNA mismatch repair endonuclease MutL [Puniceicoccales bacterium]|jgi:DNA mismatch repair protein MutL|nr:DNA mismatch repair endonuclease MutL [Puniceicoccales bacterium]
MLRSKIELLSDNVIDGIAAGEIVERPAAVVKELVENSLDAGAKHIAVSFSRGGRFSIAVGDDGSGMARDEALLAVKRHATSKLRQISDLNSLATFGFRGEALPSVAAVSKFRLMTCCDSDQVGTEIVIDGGRMVDVRDCVKFRGTKVIVENLFYNVPARRKFLKSDDTEGARIVATVKAMAFAEIGVEFSLSQDGSEIFTSPSVQNFGDRINAIFKHGERFIDFSCSADEIALSGAICDPAAGNICKKNIVSFVNGRLVRSDLIVASICGELHQIFPNHRGILAYIFIKIDPATVDVNVHPMKREVRFRNEVSLRACVKDCMARVFGGTTASAACPIPAADSITPTATTVRSAENFSSNRRPTVNSKASLDNTPRPSSMAVARQDTLLLGAFEGERGHSWRFIGKLSDEIALFESHTGLIIFNIRLAVRRVTYEKIISGDGTFNGQQQLIPIEISLSPGEEERIRRLLPVFARYGFSVYAFGKYDYKIDAVPGWLSQENAEIIVRELVSSDVDLPNGADLAGSDEVFARCTVKAIGIENYETQKAIEALRDALLICKNPLLCPFGNAIYFELPFCEMDGRFRVKNPKR